MERKIGEVFEYQGKKLKVVQTTSNNCYNCHFYDDGFCKVVRQHSCGECDERKRIDGKPVIFVEVKEEPKEQQEEQLQAEQQEETEELIERKVGEVFEYEGEKLKVVTNDSTCDGCYFQGNLCENRNRNITGICGWTRKDDKYVKFIKVTQEQQAEQPQKLNLCEILKYCPVGEPFWSPMLDNVTLLEIDQETKKVTVETISPRYSWDINNDGTITIDEVTSPEVMLYPSREQRDWSKVKYEPKKELPKTWEEFCENYPLKKGECYMNSSCGLCGVREGAERQVASDRNLMLSKQAAEAHLAYMQLHQLRDAWREGWVPDWTNELQSKYIIYNYKGELTTMCYLKASRFLSFQDEKRAKEFLEWFRDLIEKAGDLI